MNSFPTAFGLSSLSLKNNYRKRPKMPADKRKKGTEKQTKVPIMNLDLLSAIWKTEGGKKAWYTSNAADIRVVANSLNTRTDTEVSCQIQILELIFPRLLKTIHSKNCPKNIPKSPPMAANCLVKCIY